MKRELIRAQMNDANSGHIRVWQLLTVTISEDEVTFYLDLERLGSRSLPRPLTDCENAGAGFLVGSQGMQMGQLRFYTRALVMDHFPLRFALLEVGRCQKGW